MRVRTATRRDLPVLRALQSLLAEPVADLFDDELPRGQTYVAVPSSATPIAPGNAKRPPRSNPARNDEGGVGTTRTTATARGHAPGGDHPVGYVHAYTTGYVPELVVAPAFRGDGIGRALMRRALAWLRDRGVERAALEVEASNDAARALYESLEFTVVQRFEDRYESGDGFRMTVDLAE